MQLNNMADPANPLSPASPLNPANPLHPNNQRAYQTEQQKCDKCVQVIQSHNYGLIAVVIFFSILFAFCFFAFVVIFDALRDAAPRR
jgi:hypothetical protein